MACYKNKTIAPLTNPAKFKIGKLKCKIPLVQLRVLLFLANLIVLASAVASFSAGRDARNSAEDLLNQVRSFKPDTKDYTQVYEEWISAIRRHVEQILYITSLNLLLYWFIYGVAISLHFGGSYSLCVLVISVPHTLVMVLWELGLVAFFVKMTRERVDGFYATWTPTLAALLLPTCVVQLFTAILPFCISNSQRDYNNNQENGEVWHTNTPILTKRATALRATNTDYVDSSVLGPTNTDYVDSSVLGPTNTDYVDFNPEVFSLYHTEMPEQILKKNRPRTFARIRTASVSAGHRVMDTMSRIYNTERFTWRPGHGNYVSHLGDQADQVLPGRYKSYTNDDYVDKSYTNDDYMHKSYTNDDYVDKSYTNDDYMDKRYTNDDFVDKSYTNDDYVDKSYTNDDYMHKSYTNDDYMHMSEESSEPSYHSEEFLV